MINIKIVVRNINYDKMVVEFYPMLIEKCKEMKNMELLVRFLMKMDHAVSDIVREIIRRISDDTMGELLCSIFWRYEKVIIDTLTGFLQENEIGRNISVGRITAVLGMDGEIVLNILNVSVNYGGIARSSIVRQKIREFADRHTMIFKGIVGKFLEGSVEFVVGNFSLQLEKTFVNQIEKTDNKRKLLDMLSEILEKNKIILELAEISFERSDTNIMQKDPVSLDLKQEGQLFSYDLEEKILDTITQYLKMLLGESILE